MNNIHSLFVQHWHNSHANRKVEAPSGMPWLCSQIDLGLNVIASRPGMGSTTMAVSLASELALAGKRVLYMAFPSQGADKIFVRQFGLHMNIPWECQLPSENKLWEQNLPLLENIKLFYNQFLYCCSNYIEIRAKLRNCVREQHLDYIFIDCIQEITIDKELYKISVVDYICSELRALSYELNVPIVATSQLNRNPEHRCGVEGKIPQLGDFRGGNVDQYARLVYFPFRSEYYRVTCDYDGKSLKDIVNVVVEKNDDGNVGEVRLKYDREHLRFSSDKSFAEFVDGVKFSKSAPLPHTVDMPF